MCYGTNITLFFFFTTKKMLFFLFFSHFLRINRDFAILDIKKYGYNCYHSALK